MFGMIVDNDSDDPKCMGGLAIDDAEDGLRVQHRLWGGRSFTVETMPQHHVTYATYSYCRGCVVGRFARLTGHTLFHTIPGTGRGVL
jgi:hypothetical protein